MSSYSHTKSRIIQWIGIILIIGLFAGAYWYFRVRASTLNSSRNGVVTTGLVGLWSFDGKDISGTTAYDRSGSGNNGTLTNGPVVADGKIGQGLSFDGTNDYVSVPSTGTNFERTDTLSFSTWAKWNDVVPVGGYSTFFGRTGGINRGTFFSECKNASASFCNANSIAFTLTNNWTANGIMVSTATNSVTPNVWTHVTVTYNGNSNASGVHIYINGVDMPLTTHVNNLSATIIPSNPNWRIGDDYTNDWFSGRIDEFRVYNRALSAGEVQSLYNLGGGTKVDASVSQNQGTGRLDSGLAGYWPLDNGSGTSATDSSTNGNTGTLTNGPTWTTGQIGSAVQFDGSNDYVDMGNNSSTNILGNISVSIWVNSGTNSGNQYLVSKFNNASLLQYLFKLDSTGTVINFYTGDGNSSNSATGTISLGVWTHLVGIYDGSNTKLYINGVYISSASIPLAPVSSGTNLFVGSGTAGSPFNGKLDEIRVYNRTLSVDEVSQLYRLTTPTGVDTSLKGYWSFNGKDMNGTTAYDRSGAGNNGTLTNGPAVADGKVGQGLSFDGSNDYVDTSASAFDFERTSPFSLSTWYNYTGVTPVTSSRSFFGNIIGAKGYLFGLRAGGLCTTSGMIGFTLANNSSANGLGVCTTANTSFLRGWHHAVVTYSGNSNVSGINIYVDGVNQPLTTVYNNLSATTVTGAVMRLGDDRTSDYFTGQMDESRVYNRALSASEIQSLYAEGGGVKVNSSVSQNQGTGRLDSGLAGYWPLDNGSGTSATDLSTNSNTGTLTNGPTWGTGQVGGDVVFDGSNDSISISDAAALQLPQGNKISIGFWYNSTMTSGTGALYQKIDATTVYQMLVNGGLGTHTLRVYYRSYSGSTFAGIDNVSLGTYSNGTWHYVLTTFDTSTGAFTGYVDGILVTSATNIPNSNIAATGNLNIGAASGLAFAGSIDEFRIYNRVLSSNEISQLYRLTSPTGIDTSLKGYWSFNGKDLSGTTAYDRSGAGNNGTLTNGPAVADGKIGQGLSFDGSNDYVDVPYANLNFERTDPFTLSVWAKRSVIGVSLAFLGKTNGSTTGIYFIACSTALGNFCNAHSIALDMVGVGAGESLGVSTATNSLSTTMPVGVWTHVVATYDGSSSTSGVKIYMNGTSMTLTTRSNNLASSIKANVNWRIGDDYTNDWWNGSMDEVRIYNRVLSATEVQALYNSSR